MYAYDDLPTPWASPSELPANDPTTSRTSLMFRTETMPVMSGSGARMISFAPCVTIQPIEIDDGGRREIFQTIRVPQTWSEVPITDPYATHRPTGDTKQPAEALPDGMTLAALAILASIRIV
jgi:hypothetical protein